MSSCSAKLHGGKKRSMKRRTHGKRAICKKCKGKICKCGKMRKTVRRPRKTRSMFGKLFGF